MTQNWVNQVVTSLCSLNNNNIDLVWHKKLLIKSWYNSKNLC